MTKSIKELSINGSTIKDRVTLREKTNGNKTLNIHRQKQDQHLRTARVENF